MITQTEVNDAFQIGETRMEDVNSYLANDLIGHAELAGMLMGAMKAHADRREKTLLEVAIEWAELIAEGAEEL